MVEFGVAGSGFAAHVFGPRSQQEQPSAAAEIEIGAGGVEPLLEAPVFKDYHFASGLAGIVYDGFLGRMNGRSDGDGSLVDLPPASLGIFPELGFAPSAVDAHRQQIHLFQEEDIAECREFMIDEGEVQIAPE